MSIAKETCSKRQRSVLSGMLVGIVVVGICLWSSPVPRFAAAPYPTSAATTSGSPNEAAGERQGNAVRQPTETAGAGQSNGASAAAIPEVTMQPVHETHVAKEFVATARKERWAQRCVQSRTWRGELGGMVTFMVRFDEGRVATVDVVDLGTDRDGEVTRIQAPLVTCLEDAIWRWEPMADYESTVFFYTFDIRD